LNIRLHLYITHKIKRQILHESKILCWITNVLSIYWVNFTTLSNVSLFCFMAVAKHYCLLNFYCYETSKIGLRAPRHCWRSQPWQLQFTLQSPNWQLRRNEVLSLWRDWRTFRAIVQDRNQRTCYIKKASLQYTLVASNDWGVHQN